MAHHVVLVAIEIESDEVTTAEEAQALLIEHVLPNYPDENPYTPVTGWWIAEDHRVDGSDNDSAVFVPKGWQGTAAQFVARTRDLAHDRQILEAAAATADAQG